MASQGNLSERFPTSEDEFPYMSQYESALLSMLFTEQLPTAFTQTAGFAPEELALFPDIPLRAVGPETHPTTVGSPFADYPPDECCIICLEQYAATQETDPCFKLTTCGNLLHEDCLRTLINAPVRQSIRCPYCRAYLCEPRDVEGVFGNGEHE